MMDEIYLNVIQELIAYIERSDSECDLDYIARRLRSIPGVESFSDELQRNIRAYLLTEKQKMDMLNTLDDKVNVSSGVDEAALRCEKYERVFNIVKYLSKAGKLSPSDTAILHRHENNVLGRVVDLHGDANVIIRESEHPGVKKYYEDPLNEDTHSVISRYMSLKMEMLDLSEIVPTGPLPEHKIEVQTDEAL